jgi:hypothetical protein
MENTDDRRLSFPQRNWLLLCILVAILSPLLVHELHGIASKKSNETSANSRIPAPTRGTSYRMSAPPSNPRDSNYKGTGYPVDTLKSQGR